MFNKTHYSGKRWNIEVDFRNLKTTLGMVALSCKTAAMNEKEIWVYFLAYNLIRLLMLKAALFNNTLPRNLSFKHALQLCLALYNQNNFDISKAMEKDFLLMIGRQRVGNRPGRIEPRALKRRPNSFPLLMTLRAVAQEKIRNNGHPKKLK